MLVFGFSFIMFRLFGFLGYGQNVFEYSRVFGRNLQNVFCKRSNVWETWVEHIL